MSRALEKYYMTKEPLERRGLDNVKQKTHEARKRLTHLREDVGKQKEKATQTHEALETRNSCFKQLNNVDKKEILRTCCCLFVV